MVRRIGARFPGAFALPYGGLWQRRERLYGSIRRAPSASSTAVFVAAFWLSLLIASAFSSFLWWWVVGAALFGAMIMAALAAVR